MPPGIYVSCPYPVFCFLHTNKQRSKMVITTGQIGSPEILRATGGVSLQGEALPRIFELAGVVPDGPDVRRRCRQSLVNDADLLPIHFRQLWLQAPGHRGTADRDQGLVHFDRCLTCRVERRQ